jgi:hypothetical protein
MREGLGQEVCHVTSVRGRIAEMHGKKLEAKVYTALE